MYFTKNEGFFEGNPLHGIRLKS